MEFDPIFGTKPLTDTGGNLTATPEPARASHIFPRRLVIVLLLALLARLCWMAALPASAISVDLKDWMIVSSSLLKGINPYQKFDVLNWPPFWLEVLYGLSRLCKEHSEQFFLNSARLVLIAIELGVIVATFGLMRLLDPAKPIFKILLFGLAFNPLLILLTVQHANFDAAAVFWIILFLGCLVRFRRRGEMIHWLWACAFLGLAIFTKTFPFALAPLLAPGARRLSWPARCLGVALLAGPALLSLAPLYALDPVGISAHVLNYRSTPGSFGPPGLLILASRGFLIPQFARIFTCAMAGALCVLAIALYRWDVRRDADIVLLAGMLLLSLFTLGSGYGPQYWFWVVPLLAAAYPHQPHGFRILLLVAGAIVVVTNVITFAYGPVYGSFALGWEPTQAMRDECSWFESNANLMKLNMPMFAATLAVLFVGWLRIFRSMWANHGATATV